MKSRSLFIAVIVMFSAVVATFGKEEPGKTGLAIIPVKGTEVFKVIYKGEATSKVKLSIYDQNGSVIFSETLASTGGFIRPLNFNGLPSGEYTVELTNEAGKKVEKLNYFPQISTVKNIHIAKVGGENKYLIAVANDGAQTINVKVYDNANSVVYNESKEINGNFAQVYDVKDLKSGYTFEVTDTTGKTKTVKY
jgi:predicted secreted protein